MRKIICLLLLVLLCHGQALASNLTGEVGFSSEYLFRGLSQGDGSPSFQAAADYRWQKGAYVGAWGSWMLGAEEANVEVNYYIGGLMQLNSIVWNAGFIYYDYRNVPSDVARQEAYLIGYWQSFRLSYYWDLKDEPKEYVELYSRWSGPMGGDVFVLAGWQAFEENSFEPYSNYQVGWQKIWGERWSIALKYTDTRGLSVNPNSIALDFRWYINTENEPLGWANR